MEKIQSQNNVSVTIPKEKSGKNGKIELLRFVFCMAVLLFHAEKYICGEPSLKNGIHFAAFPHGSMGVEFFFVLSGFLMAKSIFKKVEKEECSKNGSALSTEYIGYIAHKYMSILPEHFVAFFITAFTFIFAEGLGVTSAIKYIVDSIPNLLLIQMSGISIKSPNHVEWYISCMLIAMAIIYPICRKYYYQFTRYFAPLASLLILGYMVYTTGRLTGVSVWTGICYKSMLRAIAEVALGTTAFEVSRYIMGVSFSKAQKLALSFCEGMCFVFTMIYMVMTFPKQYEVYVLGLVTILIILSFSQVTYGAGLFNNKLCYYLGKLSLPIYLGQLSAVYWVQGYMSTYGEKYQYIAVVIITFIVAYIIMFGGKLFRKIVNM